jgi:hypothetical protein
VKQNMALSAPSDIGSFRSTAIPDLDARHKQVVFDRLPTDHASFQRDSALKNHSGDRVADERPNAHLFTPTRSRRHPEGAPVPVRRKPQRPHGSWRAIERVGGKATWTIVGDAPSRGHSCAAGIRHQAIQPRRP